MRAFDHQLQRPVAVKVIRNKGRFHKQALVEAKVLRTIAEHDPRDEARCVRLLEHFSFRGHLCLAFELLSMSLYEFLKANCFLGVSLPLIRRFAVQLLDAFRFLRRHEIVHCDVKPENILLVRPRGRTGVLRLCALAVPLLCGRAPIAAASSQRLSMRLRDLADDTRPLGPQADRLRFGMLQRAARVRLHPEPLLPRARGAARLAVLLRHRHVVAWLRPRRALHGQPGAMSARRVLSDGRHRTPPCGWWSAW